MVRLEVYATKIYRLALIRKSMPRLRSLTTSFDALKLLLNDQNMSITNEFPSKTVTIAYYQDISLSRR
jgi:hypothetical protein